MDKEAGILLIDCGPEVLSRVTIRRVEIQLQMDQIWDDPLILSKILHFSKFQYKPMQQTQKKAKQAEQICSTETELQEKGQKPKTQDDSVG